MMRKLAFAPALILAPILGLAACAQEPEALPTPDPALVERLALASSAEPDPPEKLARADKLVTAVAHVEPARVAGAAEQLLR